MSNHMTNERENQNVDSEEMVIIKPDLYPQYTFDSFQVNDLNRFAYSASLEAAKDPGEVYNPLILHGKSSTGKTHLLFSIGNRICTEHPKMKVAYVPAEMFLRNVIAWIRSNLASQIPPYCDVDVLLLDDFQLIHDKEASMNVFIEIFNSLHMAGKQIVIAMDRAIIDIQDRIPERLYSRLNMGLVAEIGTKINVDKTTRRLSRTEREFLAQWIPYFHFDLKPGMQMKIDADLNEGTIDENQAVELRELVDYLSQRVDEFYEQNNLSEFSESITYNEKEDESEDSIRIALNIAMDMEREFLSDNCLDDYESIDELDDDTLETLDSEELKKFYDLKEFKSAVLMVDDLIKARDESADRKKLHKIRKDFELAIRDLRGIKRAKNEEAVKASSIVMIMDDLIHVCKDNTKRAILLEERQKN